jgi:hypothetical protein
VAAGTPSELKARIGDQRVDVVAVDSAGVDTLAALLGARFDITVTPARRMVSIPAPDEIVDLTAVADLVRTSGVAVDEVALRRPTLDDAFLALTGQPAETQAADDSMAMGGAMTATATRPSLTSPTMTSSRHARTAASATCGRPPCSSGGACA